MATGLEGVIRPFETPNTKPQRLFAPGSTSSPPIRLAIGEIGGTKTFSFSGSSTMSTYMAQVHTEKPSDAFDMTTGKLVN